MTLRICIQVKKRAGLRSRLMMVHSAFRMEVAYEVCFGFNVMNSNSYLKCFFFFFWVP